jgi:protein unc-80
MFIDFIQVKSLQSLRRLMICLIDIPPQFAHAVFNYVLGLLMSMVRSPLDGSQDLIVAGLTLLWQIVPYLHGLVLKDLKQILRKEQAEMMILITGNIPSTKKVIIHGPDLSQIPTQAIIQEDTQFNNVFQEALDFFGIPDSKRDRYYLIDVKTQQIHIPDTYVRDFYFFRRNIYPQLSLVHLDGKQSQRQLEHVSIYLKTTELSKVLFARYLLENTPYNQIHSCVTFFHDELIKSPSFPRKPLESDYNLYTRMSDKELFNLDMLHKYNWYVFISSELFVLDEDATTISSRSMSTNNRHCCFLRSGSNSLPVSFSIWTVKRRPHGTSPYFST